MDIKKVEEIVEKHHKDSGQLIGILQDIQAEYRYLPKHPLEKVSELLEIPLSQVFSVATFFRAFSLEPRGKHSVHVCMGTACHVRGAKRVLDELERSLEVKAGHTTADKEITLETVNCVGTCALGPIVVVDGEYHGYVTPVNALSVVQGKEKK